MNKYSVDISRNKRSYTTCNLSSSGKESSSKRFEKHHTWTLSDAVELDIIEKRKHIVKLPLKSFNHIAREVISIEKSRRFYVDILGFTEVPRPPFDCDGYWLFGYGLSLHLVATTVPEYRRQLKRTRIEHFSTALPQVDHMAFITDDLADIQKILDEEKVYYKADEPGKIGIKQIFFFDPDGNVIEVSNCQPDWVNCEVEKSEMQQHLQESSVEDSNHDSDSLNDIIDSHLFCDKSEVTSECTFSDSLHDQDEYF
mmetsp:Transcript_22655/g.20579  ORF Transcript_22655/g.20579 Transcript_22655/m.20579 type:complete len:255 (+) Transcript_22655:112-876(+)